MTRIAAKNDDRILLGLILERSHGLETPVINDIEPQFVLHC